MIVACEDGSDVRLFQMFQQRCSSHKRDVEALIWRILFCQKQWVMLKQQDMPSLCSFRIAELLLKPLLLSNEMDRATFESFISSWIRENAGTLIRKPHDFRYT